MSKQFIKNGQKIAITVDDSFLKQRIDQFLNSQLPAYSRSFFHRAIEKGLVTVNNAIVIKSGHTIKPGDLVEILFPVEPIITKEAVKAADLQIDIIYKHEHFFIINKPAGLIVHTTHPTESKVTLTDWIIHTIENIDKVGNVDRPGIVHRLDRLTSGLMIIARTNYAFTQFSQMFQNRTIEKVYKAIVTGHPPEAGTINLYIARNPIERTKMATYESPKQALHTKARTAITHYEVEEYFNNAATLRVKLETGRTHQIRAHLAAIGHPIIGDVVYGTASPLINRQALHAQKLAFVFENKEFSFEAPLPEDMRALVEKLKEK